MRFKKENIKLAIILGFVWVLENLESPGNLLWHFPGLESHGKRLLVLERSGIMLKSSLKK